MFTVTHHEPCGQGRWPRRAGSQRPWLKTLRLVLPISDLLADSRWRTERRLGTCPSSVLTPDNNDRSVGVMKNTVAHRAEEQAAQGSPPSRAYDQIARAYR